MEPQLDTPRVEDVVAWHRNDTRLLSFGVFLVAFDADAAARVLLRIERFDPVKEVVGDFLHTCKESFRPGWVHDLRIGHLARHL